MVLTQPDLEVENPLLGIYAFPYHYGSHAT